MRRQVRSWRMLLHPGDDLTERLMWLRGQPPEMASISRLTLLVAGKRALVFDAGANCGTFALPLAEAAGAGSRIVAFEPNPVMAQRLRTNLALNGLAEQVEVVEVALAAKRSDTVLHLHGENLGASSIRPPRTTRSAATIPVVTRPLCDFLPPADARGFEIFVLKVDVEGYEDEVVAPFLEDVPPEALPDAILMETVLAYRWRVDVRQMLDGRGYTRIFEGEDGNTLFVKGRIGISA